MMHSRPLLPNCFFIQLAQWRRKEGDFRPIRGRALSIDLTYVGGGIERGKRNPSLLVMVRIADALSVPLTKLLAD
jgi:hypothetical protein